MEEIINYGHIIIYIRLDLIEISRIYASLVRGMGEYVSSVWSRGSSVLSSSFLWVRFLYKEILNNGCLNHPHAHTIFLELTY
jgi:hypothetical protein